MLLTVCNGPANIILITNGINKMIQLIILAILSFHSFMAILTDVSGG